MPRQNPGVHHFLLGVMVPLLALVIAAPGELFAGRPSGGARGGGSGSSGSSASRTSSGSSVRQSHVQGSQGSGVSRSSVQNTQPSRSAGQAQSGNRNTNVNQNTTVNRNTNVNVDQDVHRNVNNADIENVAVGEEHAYVKTEEGGVWVGEGEVHVHEDHDALRVAAGVAGVMAIGAMIATPPPSYTPVVVGPTSYYYADGAYYSQVYSGGEVAYQVVAPPVGAVVTVLPSGCVDHAVGGVPYKNCGGYYYQQQGANWVVVQL